MLEAEINRRVHKRPTRLPHARRAAGIQIQTSNYKRLDYGQNAGGRGHKSHPDRREPIQWQRVEYVRNRVFNAANYVSYVTA